MIGYDSEVSSLTNLRVGPEGYKVKLTVKVSKVVASGLWFYNIWSDQKKGYSSGDGGAIRVTLSAKGVDLVSMVYRPKETPFLAKLMFGKALTLNGEVTILWENVADKPEENWASVNAMQMVGKNGNGLEVYWKGDRLFEVNDKLLIWDFLDSNGELLNVGYNYYEVWSKEPRLLTKVRQVVDVTIPSFCCVALLVDGWIGNSCCILESGKERWVGKGGVEEGKIGEGGQKRVTYAFRKPIPSPSPFTVTFLCDSRMEPYVWPIRKAVLSFGYAECTNPSGEWVGWSYWGKDNLRLSTLPISFC